MQTEHRGKHAVIHCDGASRGNPGPSGAGAVVRIDGAEEIDLHEWLGTTTNNVAEYRAAILGIRAALEAGATSVEVRADSQLLIRQLQGRYRVKAVHLKPLYAEARGLLDQFRRVSLIHVPRRENKGADKLANQAIDQARLD